MDSFSKSHDKFWQDISAKDPDVLAESSGVIYSRKDNVFKVRLIDDTFIVDPLNRAIKLEDLSDEPSFETKLIIVTYLSLNNGHKLSGEWCTEQLLPYGSIFFRGLHALSFQKIIDCYADNISKLKARSVQLRGREIKTNGDLGIEFWLLPKIPVQMIYWKKDEEFPEKVSFFFDKHADKFLYLDGIGAIIKLLIKKLTEKQDNI